MIRDWPPDLTTDPTSRSATDAATETAPRGGTRSNIAPQASPADPRAKALATLLCQMDLPRRRTNQIPTTIEGFICRTAPTRTAAFLSSWR